MSARAIKAGEAFLELRIRDTAFAKGLQQAAAKLRSFGTSLTYIGASMSAAGAALLAPFIASLKVFADVGSALFDMSARTGIAVDALSSLKYAAEQSGSDIGAVEVAIKRMQKALVEAGKGSKTAISALQTLGLTFGDLQGLSPDKQFELIASRIAALPTPAQKTAAAMTLFGRSGTALLPMIANLAGLQQRFEELGGKWTPEMAKAADDLGDAMGDLKVVFAAVSAQVAAALAPIVTRVAIAFANASSGAIDWIRNNKVLVQSVAGAGAALAALGLTITSLGIFFITAGAAISGLVAVMAALTSTTAIVIAAVSGLVVAFVKFTTIGQQMASFLATQFQELLRVAGETFSGIGDALAAGDIQAAANVLWAGLKLAWLQGTEDMRVALASFKNDALGIFVDLSIGIERTWANMIATLQSFWTEGMGGIVTGIDLLFTRLDMIGDSPRQQLQKLAGFLKRQDAREKITAPKLASIEEERKAKMKALDELSKAADNLRDEQKDKDIKAAAEAGVKAQKEFEEARKKAAAARAGLGGNFKAQFQAALGDIGSSAKIASSRSTFSGALAGQIFGAGAPDQIPRQQLIEQRKARVLLERIERKKAFALRVGGN